MTISSRARPLNLEPDVVAGALVLGARIPEADDEPVDRCYARQRGSGGLLALVPAFALVAAGCFLAGLALGLLAGLALGHELCLRFDLGLFLELELGRRECRDDGFRVVEQRDPAGGR